MVCYPRGLYYAGEFLFIYSTLFLGSFAIKNLLDQALEPQACYNPATIRNRSSSDRSSSPLTYLFFSFHRQQHRKTKQNLVFQKKYGSHICQSNAALEATSSRLRASRISSKHTDRTPSRNVFIDSEKFEFLFESLINTLLSALGQTNA